MLSEGAQAQALARDTLMAAIMITINGIIGICLLAGGRRHHEQRYTQSGVSAGLAMLATLSVLTLILPNYTISASGAFYNSQQLVFVAIISLLIYATFVVAQTIRHRDHFLHHIPDADDYAHEAPVPRPKAIAAGVVMLVALGAVVLLAIVGMRVVGRRAARTVQCASNIRQLTIAPLIAEAMRRISEERSVSSLFD